VEFFASGTSGFFLLNKFKKIHLQVLKKLKIFQDDAHDLSRRSIKYISPRMIRGCGDGGFDGVAPMAHRHRRGGCTDISTGQAAKGSNEADDKGAAMMIRV
jgi:hypothetical protein